jgi:ABC-type Zn uptake system ZnuABC Zn-binding protein ZnuA
MNSPVIRFIITLVIAALTPLEVRANLNVVTTLPDLGDIARQIGGKHVDVTTLAKPTEDPHFVDARPSFVLKLNQADVLIDGGADLEAGWLGALLENSRNPKIRAGAPGRIVASQGIKMLGVPDTLSREHGDIHAKGNPHFLTDPLRAEIAAKHIATVFSELDPKSASFYQANLVKFNAEIQGGMKRWTQTLAPYRGQTIAAYHDSWIYFGNRFGLKIDLFLEPKPGIPPSASHLVKVIDAMKADHVKAILVEPFHDRKIAESVASRTGATVVAFAQYPGGLTGTESYIALMDRLVTELAKALAK